MFCSEELSSLPCQIQNKSLSFSYLVGKFKFAVWWDHIPRFFHQANFISSIILFHQLCILSLLIFLIKGCLQRLDYNVLVPFLQPKHEYVLCISLTPFQKKLYEHYLENFARAGQIGADGKLEGGRKGGLFYDVQNLSRVWNHPYILLKAKVSWYGFMLNTQWWFSVGICKYNHMICYKFECSHWWKSYLKKRILYKICSPV